MRNLKPTTELFANRFGWSDVEPYEIVRIVSDKCIEVRLMDTGENKTKMDWVSGGFTGHCTNQNAQDYDYTSNPDNPVSKIRLNKRGWQNSDGQRFGISEKPYKFHDYNF